MPINDRIGRISGSIVLFLVIFLPGYLYQSSESAARSLSNPSFLLQNIVIGVPHILLLLYMTLSSRSSSSADYGLTGLRLRSAPQIIAILAGIALISSPVAIIGRVWGGNSQGFVGTIQLNIGKTSNLFLLSLMCLVTGYREELFFRSYFFVEVVALGQKEYVAIAVSTLLFSIGHLYEGIASFLGTAAAGIFLGWCFVKTRNIHVLAISHAMYNFGIIVLTYLVK